MLRAHVAALRAGAQLLGLQAIVGATRARPGVAVLSFGDSHRENSCRFGSLGSILACCSAASCRARNHALTPRTAKRRTTSSPARASPKPQGEQAELGILAHPRATAKDHPSGFCYRQIGRGGTAASDCAAVRAHYPIQPTAGSTGRPETAATSAAARSLWGPWRFAPGRRAVFPRTAWCSACCWFRRYGQSPACPCASFARSRGPG